MRMHVEQAFGMLVSKCRILLKMQSSVETSAQVIFLCAKLHNFCIDHGDKINPSPLRTRHDLQILSERENWYEEGKHLCLEEVGRQNGRRFSVKRDKLFGIIKESGFRRPPVVTRRMPSYFFGKRVVFEYQSSRLYFRARHVEDRQ